ncbi:protein associated with UVRAG as autophagy enhancer isoform X2 [Rana temporaria]|uniref:protein associated with UVRAG as autophagy enhancer isoform X2 n=1 Tax=Rana temporaria TaxID=8407 RepID=UPI001AAC9638|nr:protein associated with UVRAG as autophagy enhancer isoform X2 [Rana temporaria]
MYSFALHARPSYYFDLLDLSGCTFYGLPTMSVHALTLTDYNTKRVQTCTSVAQASSDVSLYTGLKTKDVPDPPLTKLPRIPTIRFPTDELPRPAVIGLGGSNGSYVDSTTAIKEILASVLKIPSTAKSTLTVNTNIQDSDAENWGESSNDDSDSDSECAPLSSSSQHDIRLTRHKASWDNSKSDSPVTFAVESTTSSHNDPITSSKTSDTKIELSPFLKCDQCAEVLLTGSSASQPNFTLNAQKDRRFSSPNLSSLTLNLNHNSHDPPSEKDCIPLLTATVDTDTCAVEESKTFHRRSKSYSSIPKAENLTSSTELHDTAENLFEPAVNLEKENEHFLAAELFMAVVERMKSNWQYEQWKTEGGMYWIKRDQEEPCFHRKKANSESAASVDSGYEGLAALQNSPVETIFEEDESQQSIKTLVCEDYEDYVIIELDDCEKLYTPKQSNDMPERRGLNSAEQIAKNLYRAFRQQWTQVDGEVQLPTRIPADDLADDQTIAEEFESSISLVEEIKKFRIRDAEEWSPRFQIISTIHPYIKRDVIVASQNYLCAGCGTQVEPRYTNRLRYCDYMGKYFCDCCHGYTESFIPGRILSKWHFSKYYVSNFAKSVVDKIWDSHLFNVQTENPALYKKVKDLNRVQEVQEQLIHIRKLVSTCRFADGIIKAFEEVPSHLTQELHLYTLSDLYKVKQKSLLQSLQELLATAVAHVDQCELCQAKGFICELCQEAEVIFPFQTQTCRRCEVCKACYHKQCFKTRECPKCTRIKAREALKSDSPFTSSGETDSNSMQ